jgi:segregation and condensation protein A
MDIMDINVHEITKQYLEYIKRMKELDLEMAGDFVAMAATLIHIKSRMLLPNYDEDGEEIEQEDPRKELVQKLLEYQMYQEASKKLYERPLMRRDFWVRGEKEIHMSDEDGEIIVEDGGLFALIASYKRVLNKVQKNVHKVGENTQSIASRIMEIKNQLVEGVQLGLSKLITAKEAPKQRYQLLITFLSVLELAKMGFLSVFQSENFEDIHITAKKSIDDNAISNVEEYDNIQSEDLADEIFEQAEIESELDFPEGETEAPEASMASDEEIEEAEAEFARDDESPTDYALQDELPAEDPIAESFEDDSNTRGPGRDPEIMA